MHIIILGGPGSGKGTQSEKIIKSFSLKHLSTGDMLRDEIYRQTDLGQKAKIVIDKGNLVSNEIILEMVANKLKQIDKGILFDGFPRTIAQAEGLDELLAKNSSSIRGVILLKVNNEELVKRMRGGGRTNDNEETIYNRVSVFESETKPLIEFYQQQNKLIEIDGMGTIDDIFSRIEAELSYQ